MGSPTRNSFAESARLDARASSGPTVESEEFHSEAERQLQCVREVIAELDRAVGELRKSAIRG